MKWAWAFLAVCLAGQVAFWRHTHDVIPEMTIVPSVPGVETVKALSLGDDQFFFRFLALNIQNFGDTFGRFTALKRYDFNRLYQWLHLLDQLDRESNYLPSMATYYFSQTQRKKDVKYIVDYLREHVDGRLETKWWWAVQAVYLANHKLKDQDLALELAKPLSDLKDVPIWVRQLPAFVYEKRGEMDSASEIIKQVLQNSEQLTEGELNFMRYFVEERLDRLKQVDAELKKAKTKAVPNIGNTPEEQP